MDFRKYMHVERYGTDGVQGIELGQCYIFPKLDGTNASTWLSNDADFCAGSRNRELSLEKDNAGFLKWSADQPKLNDFHLAYPHLTLYGEWLVPHTLKIYRDDAWRRFYVFDVWDWSDNCYLHYDAYKSLLEEFNINYIPAMRIIQNATYDSLLKVLDANTFLVRDGEGAGEGIVVKNYDFKNKFGRTTWAKMCSTKFKDKHMRVFEPSLMKAKIMIEQIICDEYVTKHLVDKVYAKIANEMEGWNSKYIPRLIGTVFHDLVNEELWQAIKKFKYPTVNFKTLNGLTTRKIKALLPELF